MLGNPLTAFSDDWEICLDADLRKLGQVALVATLRSPALAVRRMSVFTSFDGSALVRSLARSAQPLAAMRGLLGTSSGPITSNPWFPCRCQRLFSLAQLDGRVGHARGFTAGAAFGYCYLTLEAPGLFAVRVHGLTASVMFPSVGTVSGRWFLLGPASDLRPVLFDAPQSGHRSKSQTA
jgi:hypothetical protein